METVSTNSTYTFTVTGNRSLTAVFEKIIPTYTVTASIDPPEAGTVTGAGQYQEGATVTLTATVNDGYTFSGWQENGQIVSTDNPYIFTISKDTAFTAVFKEKVSRLPSGYVEVEYIESNGTEGIDTGLTPTGTIKLTIDVYPLTETTTSQYLVTSYGYVSARGYWFGAIWGNVGVVIAKGAGSSLGNVSVTLSNDKTPRRMSITIDYPARKASIAGEAEVSLSGISIYTGMSNITLLSNSSGKSGPNARMYSCEIEIDGETVRNFVPCLNPSGVAGLYDIINKTFYSSFSATDFTAGPAV